MRAALLEGKPLAKRIEARVADEVRLLIEAGVTPCLCVVLVGADPASATYVRSKEKACQRVGVTSKTVTLPGSTPESELSCILDDLNRDPTIHGILVQLPLPPAIRAEAVLCGISPSKDVDGVTPENMGKLLLGFPYTVPCTPAGIIELLDASGISIEGKHVVIVGRSNIVGKPLAALLMQKTKGRNCTVTICHSKTRDVAELTRLADVVVTAMGSPRFLTADMVRPGCIVVDVGITRVSDPSSEKGYVLVGDADFGPLAEKASWITPVPGGVGPLTVAMLLMNTVKVARYLACRP